MDTAVISITLNLILVLVLCGALGYLLYLAIRALRKYLRSAPAREEKAERAKSLGQVLKEHRMERGMTQEFVAEALGVSRQAVSKWESGRSDPSTTNLLALAKLFGVPPEELLREGEE